jgi:hypothetical protein
MSTIGDVARDFTALLRAGDFEAAAARYLAVDVTSVTPRRRTAKSPDTRYGHVAAHDQSSKWIGAGCIDDLSVDGPFVTGDQFALFMDMMIVDRTTGAAWPFAEIAVFTVRGAKITEERYFYD